MPPKNATREMCHVTNIVSDETALGITWVGIVYIYDNQIPHIPQEYHIEVVVRLLGTRLGRATSLQYIQVSFHLG